MNKLIPILIVLSACMTEVDLELTESELIATNSLSSTQLQSAKLAANAIGTSSLSSNSTAIRNLVSTTAGRAVFTQTVKCALASGSSVTATDNSGTVYTFQGQYGVATSWATSVPTASQRRWVTSCVLGTTNLNGLSVQVSLRHDTFLPYLSTATERATYSSLEAGFYGDLYTTGGQLYACTSQVWGVTGNPITDSLRSCYRSTNGTTTLCGYQYTGLCSTACTDATAPYSLCLGGSTRYSEVATLYKAP